MTADIAVRIPELEVWLDERSVPWKLVPAFDVAGIDYAAGLDNQARLRPLDDEVVERYTADMVAGAVFPAIVLRVVQDGDPSPLGGNHRLAAARAARRPVVAAYSVGPMDDLTAQLLALEDNRRHGLPLTDEERLYHAVELSRTAFRQEEAASIAGIPVSKLRLQLQANKAAGRAMKHSLDGWFELSTTSRARLAGIGDDRVFVKASRAVVAGHVPSVQVNDFVKRIHAAPGTAEACSLIEDIVMSARKTVRRTGGRPPSAITHARIRLLGDLDAVMRFQPDVVAADCASDLDRKRVSEQCKAAARHLMIIEKELWA